MQKRLREAGIAVEAFWGNAMHPPTDDAVKKARGKEDAKYALTGMAARLAKGVAAPEKAPQRLPAFPRAAKQVAGQIPVHPKIGGGTTRAVAVMKRMDRSTEMLAIERTPDLAVQIKLFLDYGALSPKMVAQHAVTVTGAWKGRTFSELVWREYVCFAAHRGSGVAVKQTVAV